jgi:DNA-binding response OmpR family regulator
VRILLVEDEATLREGLKDLLEVAGHTVTAVADGSTAVTTGLTEVYELVVLDLMLPDIDGLEVCRRLREARPVLPVLMLTARGSEDDKVAGLGAGADDYLTKPFGARELLARINALTRRLRSLPDDEETIDADGCHLDLGRLHATRGAVSTSLSPREAGILRWLHRHRNRAVPRSELLEHVWGASADMQTRTVDMAIVKLRQKIEREPNKPRIVITVAGVGYAWGDLESG